MDTHRSTDENAVAVEIGRLASGASRELGLEVVEVSFHRGAKAGLLRILIEAPGTPGVTLQDCERLSREMDRLLEEGDLIQEGYVLEVSSPGIDRPIRTDDDVRRNTGRQVEVETREPISGRSVFEGLLVGWDETFLRLRLDDGDEVAIPRSSVAKARQRVEFRPQGKPGGKPRRRDRRGIV